VGDYGSLPLYHMLGYFSLIGLLRVHVLLGDFTLALKVVENVELNQKVSERIFSQRVSFCVLGSHAAHLIESLYPRYCLSCRDVLLRGILLHHASPLPRRNPCLCANFEFHPANATIPYKKLPV
jgi:RNA polymerase I-associated factor PAF67